MTPGFLRIAKNTNNAPLLTIRDEHGQQVSKVRERGEHIRSFYEELYKMPPDAPANLEGCVEDFLGADICNNPIIQGMRISQAEKEQLDRPITFDELDNALKTSNKKSAPGIDGVDNKLITIIWGLVRKPLLKCAECCFSKGKIIGQFRTA